MAGQALLVQYLDVQAFSAQPPFQLAVVEQHHHELDGVVAAELRKEREDLHLGACPEVTGGDLQNPYPGAAAHCRIDGLEPEDLIGAPAISRN